MRNKIQTPWKYTEIKDIYSFPPPMAFANTKFWEMIALEFLKVFRHQIMEGTFKDFYHYYRVHICVCRCVCVRQSMCLPGPEEGFRKSGTEVKGGCESPDVDVRPESWLFSGADSGLNG